MKDKCFEAGNLYLATYLLYCGFAMSFMLANILKINIIFGALLAGIVINKISIHDIEIVKKYIKELSMAFFIPIYFAIVGLRLDLIRYFDFSFTVGFLIFTSFFFLFAIG